MENLGGLITTQEAADLLEVNYWTVQRLGRLGKLRVARKIGRAFLFSRADVLVYKENAGKAVV